MGFHKILCPVDFSDDSRDALRRAAEFARESGASLVLAHVWEPSSWMLGSETGIAPSVLQDIIDGEEADLAKWRASARELGAKELASKFLTGTAWDQIVRTAEADPSIDLIVMGTHGRTGLRHALLGSVAEKVVRHAPCAVLVVRSRPTPAA